MESSMSEKIKEEIYKITKDNNFTNIVLSSLNNFSKCLYLKSQRILKATQDEKSLYVTWSNDSVSLVFIKDKNLSSNINFVRNNGIVTIMYVTKEEYDNKNKTAPSTRLTSREYLYDEDMNFLMKKKEVKDESYVIKNGFKKIVSNVWHCNFIENEIVTRINKNTCVKNLTKKYISYNNHDTNDYYVCNYFEDGMYYSSGNSDKHLPIYDKITKEEYDIILENKDTEIMTNDKGFLLTRIN